MQCEFEEKQYEQHLNNELLMRKNLLYVPGQVLEGKLGFDAAVYSMNPKFWRLFDHAPYFPFFRRWFIKSKRPGVVLMAEWWEELEHAVSFFPQFQFNVFVQHKRPEYLTTARSKQWEDWQRPYYRYRLTDHQQEALENLEDKLNNEAIVVYASPAFIKHSELWDAIKNTQLIEKSNFCQPINLRGHHSYSYAKAGNIGKAHSESENIESFDFYEKFNQLSKSIEYSEGNLTFIIRLGDTVHKAIQNCGELTHAYNKILSNINIDVKSKFYLAMARISTFNFVTGSIWLVNFN